MADRGNRGTHVGAGTYSLICEVKAYLPEKCSRMIRQTGWRFRHRYDARVCAKRGLKKLRFIKGA